MQQVWRGGQRWAAGGRAAPAAGPQGSRRAGFYGSYLRPLGSPSTMMPTPTSMSSAVYGWAAPPAALSWLALQEGALPGAEATCHLKPDTRGASRRLTPLPHTRNCRACATAHGSWGGRLSQVARPAARAVCFNACIIFNSVPKGVGELLPPNLVATLAGWSVLVLPLAACPTLSVYSEVILLLNTALQVPGTTTARSNQ